VKVRGVTRILFYQGKIPKSNNLFFATGKQIYERGGVGGDGDVIEEEKPTSAQVKKSTEANLQFGPFNITTSKISTKARQYSIFHKFATRTCMSKTIRSKFLPMQNILLPRQSLLLPRQSLLLPMQSLLLPMQSLLLPRQSVLLPRQSLYFYRGGRLMWGYAPGSIDIAIAILLTALLTLCFMKVSGACRIASSYM